MTTAENIWKTQAVSHFTTEEISTAKSEMWSRCGEQKLGNLMRRQGSSKTKAELDDMSAAFKSLAENDMLPLFIASSETLRRTPIFNVDLTNNTNDAIATSLKILEETINAAISMNKGLMTNNEKMVDENTSSAKSNSINITSSSNGLYSDIVAQQATNKSTVNNEKEIVQSRQNGILHGTARDQSRDTTFAANIDLVAYGVATQVTGIGLSKFIEDKGIKVLDCVLLTKYEHAWTFSYKVTIRACDYEKSQDASIWPYRIGVHPFKNAKSRYQNSALRRNHQNTKQNYDNSIRKDYNAMQLYSSDNRRGIRNGDIDNPGVKLVNNNKRRNRIERQTSSDNRKGIQTWNMDN